MAYIDHNGNYYEGDRIDTTDIECVTRPSSYHKYNIDTRKWTIDDVKVNELKKRKASDIARQYNLYLASNSPLAEDTRHKIEEVYNNTIKVLINSTDPKIIERIELII